jgi:hypothetical protein
MLRTWAIQASSSHRDGTWLILQKHARKASEAMSDDKQEIEVFEMASGDISIWVDGGIHLKVNTPGKDPVELGEQEALKLGELLVRLAIEQRA